MELLSNLRYNLDGDSMLIKGIKVINGKVEIIIDNQVLKISKENYINNPLIIGNEISGEKIDEILEYERVINSKIYIIKLLNKKALSEYEVKSKLKDRMIDNDSINKIINELKRSGLINDEYVAFIYVETMLVKRKGKLVIIEGLKDKRIKKEIIDKVISEIDENLYRDNFNKVVDKYKKMYSNKSSKLKRLSVVNKLKEQGYEEYLINDVVLEKDNKIEIELARKHLMKILSNKRIDLSSYENINKIKIKLSLKGFSYDIINLVLGEVLKDETN